jgi:hypothetical protein
MKTASWIGLFLIFQFAISKNLKEEKPSSEILTKTVM